MLTNVLIPFFGADLLANEIRRRDLSRWLDSMVAEGKRAAANRYYTIARRCFNWGVEVDLLDHSPTVGVRLPIREQPRDRLITPDEVNTLWKGLPKSPASQHAVRITLATVTHRRSGYSATMPLGKGIARVAIFPLVWRITSADAAHALGIPLKGHCPRKVAHRMRELGWEPFSYRHHGRSVRGYQRVFRNDNPRS